MAVMEALLKIRADVTGTAAVDKLGKSIGGVEKSAGSLSKGLGGLATSAGSVVSALAAVAAGGALKGVMDTFGSYEADILTLERGLKNLGGNAPQYLEPLKKIASDLGEQTLFNEEDFNKGFGLLTSFGNIGVEQYKRVAMAASDVAQVSGTDVQQAMMQLAKALNAPSQGVSALARSGIQFTEAQKAMIKSMEESGNIAGAQELIFKELEKQYGGASVAAAGGFAGAMDTLGEKFYDVQKALGPLLEAGLKPLISILTITADVLGNQIIPLFTSLPEPLQAIVGVATVLVVALAAIAPVLAVITPGLVQLAAVLGSLQLGAVIAGWAGAIVPAITAISSAIGAVISFVTGTAAPAIIAFFSGPVGWIALAVAAGVAIFAFRDQIGAAFKAIGDVLGKAAKFFYNSYVEPVIKGGESVIRGLQSAFSSLVKVITSPFKSGVEAIKNLFRSLLQFVASGINKATSGIRGLISSYNSIPTLPDVPNIPTVSVPAFAAGGVVSQPTLAMVGERGREYIIPEDKMAQAAANYLSGVRGDGVIPAFANGGTAGASAGGGAANTTVQITTGPVLQQDGQRYVTIGDLERALQDYGAQIFRNSRSYGGRRYQGAY
jgi:hypothetical protein